MCCAVKRQQVTKLRSFPSRARITDALTLDDAELLQCTSAASARSDVRSAAERSALPKIGFAWTEIGDQNNANDTLWYVEANAIRNAIGLREILQPIT